MSDLSELVGRLEGELGPAGGPPVALSGGITNRNYRLRLGGRDCVLRLPGQDTGLLGIDRVSERLAAERAASLGIGPQLLHADAECMVTAFVPGTPSTRSGCVLTRVRSRARCAPSMTAALELPVRFWIPDLLAVYADTVTERGGALPGAFLRAQALVERIAAVLPLTEPVPCHNDLLPGNLIQTDSHVLLVDWEYAGLGHRYFDLGNLAVNNEFDDDAERRLLEAYFGEPAALCRLSALRLFRLVSDAREGAWGVVQGLISELDFDFTAYADEHFERLERAAADPQLEELLNAATP